MTGPAYLTVLTVAQALFLLWHLKGVIVAVQWAKRMHGFGKAPDRDNG